MSPDPPTAFEDEPIVRPLPFLHRPFGRVVSMVLVIALLVGLLGGLSCLMSNRRIPPSYPVVVAAQDLRPYQRLEEEDVEMGQVDHVVDGTVLTDTTQLPERSMVLREVDKGQAITADSVVIFPSAVIPTDAVILAIPLSQVQATFPALESGSTVLVIGVTLSDTVSPSVYPVTVPLVDVTDSEVVIAVSPRVAVELSSHFAPRGQLVLAPTANH